MRVSEIQVIPTAEAVQLQGLVESDCDADDAFWFAPFILWYRFPAWCAPFLSADNGDPFLAALLVPAMRTRERLAISAPISPRLLEALSEIQAIYDRFDQQNSLVPVEVSARHTPLPATTAAPAAGLFFSLGVDSFYSLLKQQREHPADDTRLTHLISVHGFDVAPDGWDETFPPRLLANFQRVAAETGTSLVPVTTNVRRVTERLAPWTMVHGGAMASIALALGAAFRRVTFAATTTYDRLFPWGSHPVLDPLWSTEGLCIVHDGCELNVIDKTRVIAHSELALATLRPCAGHGPGYNCGRCMKCMRTMLDLLQAGALDRCQTLPHEIDPAQLRRSLRPGGQTHMAEYRRRLEGLAALGTSPAVCAVLAEHLAQGMARRFEVRMGLGGSRPAPRRSLVARVLRRIGR